MNYDNSALYYQNILSMRTSHHHSDELLRGVDQVKQYNRLYDHLLHFQGSPVHIRMVIYELVFPVLFQDGSLKMVYVGEK